MGDNGKASQELVKIILEDGNMKVELADTNFALLSHAIRLASLELDTCIVAKDLKEQESKIQVSKSIIDRIR